jgi:flagellar basal-body rod protein FlgC
MDLFSSMRVSATGLDAQTKRMNTISSNLANAETTRTAEGGPYRREDPIVAAETDRESFGEILDNELDEHVQGVRVQGIHKDERPPRMVYNPSHPDADPQTGMVAMPNVNTVEEMANMISAQRSYEANVTAMNAAKSMANKALEIGR